MANHLSQDQQERLIRALGKGVPIRHIAHILDIHIDTVARYVRLAGQMAIDFIDVVQQDMEIKRAEVDEFYSYIAAKRQNAHRMKNPVEGAGEAVHYLSVVPGTAFIANYLVAPSSDQKHTTDFIRDLGRRMKRLPGGDFVVKPTIVSDGYVSYESAIGDVWGTRMNHWKLTKTQSNVGPDGKKTRWKFAGVFRSTPIGDPADEEFWQNDVESVNRTARCQNRRVARRGNAFSKRLQPHVHQFAFWIFYHNYAVIPSRKKLTPAMQAGVIDRFFDTKTIVKMLNQYQLRAEEEGLLSFARPMPAPVTPPVPDVLSDPTAEPLWLYHNFAQNSVRIHKPTCTHAKGGGGHGGKTERSGRWVEAYGMEAAKAIGDDLAPTRVSVCKMCLGETFRLGRRN